MFRNLTATAVVDLSASTNTTFTYETVGAGYLLVDQITGTLEEAIAVGGFTSTAGIVQIQVGSTVVAEFSTGTTTAALAIGQTVEFTPDTTNAPEGVFTVAAGDIVTVKLTTQGTGGTVTGTLRVNIPMEEDLG
jgi:hypothetical protein